MHTFQQFSVRGQSLCLTPGRAVFWEEEKALIVSDLHFGKSGHFRKAGIGVPQTVFKDDMQRLVMHIQYFQPASLIVVGDMFHSSANRELDLFAKWRSDFNSLRMLLALGNHDILKREWYAGVGIEVFEPGLRIGPFSFCHSPEDCYAAEESAKQYVFCGHIHPGVTVNGMGRQRLHFPCFYFTPRYCVLPAFSRFTGTCGIQPGKEDAAFAIVNSSILKVA